MTRRQAIAVARDAALRRNQTRYVLGAGGVFDYWPVAQWRWKFPYRIVAMIEGDGRVLRLA